MQILKNVTAICSHSKKVETEEAEMHMYILKQFAFYNKNRITQMSCTTECQCEETNSIE